MRESKLTNYEIKEEIGRGSYATVYKAINLSTGQICAAKKIEQPTQEIKQLMQEINIIQECDCRNIVRFLEYQIIYDPFRFYIIMEYCAGGSVKDVMRQLKRSLKERQIVVILRDILNGLDYLHSKNQIHRDVKAANILLHEEGVAKLADFGVSEPKPVGTTMTSTRKTCIIGTPLWLPPEVLNLDPNYGLKIDVWSLGITIIEMAEREPPFHDWAIEKAHNEIKNLERPSPSFRNPDLWDPGLVDFLRLCLEKDPAKRKSANELLSERIIQEAPSNNVIKELVSEVCLGRSTSSEIESNLYRKSESLLRECVNLFSKYKERRMKVIMVDQMTNSLFAVNQQFMELQDNMVKRNLEVSKIQSRSKELSDEVVKLERKRNELKEILDNQRVRKLNFLDQLDKIREKQKKIETLETQRRMKLRSLEGKSN